MLSTCAKSFLRAAVGVVALSTSAWASPIGPGFDLWHTLPGTQFGGIAFQGVPIAGLGNTDTIVQRTGSLPPGGTGDIPIEIVALSLVSVQPVNINGFFFDVFATIDTLGLLGPPTALPPSIGRLTVTSHNDPLGGTFDSFFDVFTVLTFTEVGNPLNTFGVPVQDALRGSGTWSHSAPPGYPSHPRFPSGGFYPDPLTERGNEGIHVVEPALVPEPSTLALLMTGALGLIAAARRRR